MTSSIKIPAEHCMGRLLQADHRRSGRILEQTTVLLPRWSVPDSSSRRYSGYRNVSQGKQQRISRITSAAEALASLTHFSGREVGLFLRDSDNRRRICCAAIYDLEHVLYNK